MTINVEKPRPASPCIGACGIDPATGYCTGCARTGAEIAAWGGADEAERQRIWAALPARARTLGLQMRRLPWRGASLLDAIETRFATAAGTFVVGVPGAVAEVLREPDEPFERVREADTLTVRTRRAALWVEAPAFLTAFEIAREGRAPLIALAVPAGRADAAGPTTLTALGADPQALLARDADGLLFDVGLGRRGVRFSIRCAPALAPRIAAHCGTPWPQDLARIGAAVVEHSPVRVVETPCLRAEIDAVIPPPDGRSPEGPHTHLLPDLLAQGEAGATGLPLPKGYLLTALFHPA